MNRLFIYFLILLLVSLESCSNSPTDLQSAEQLMETAPDSSLHILQKLPSNKINGRYNRALYALLKTQALIKNDSIIDNDSLISIATDYFDESDPIHAGYAWLYHARTAFYRDSLNEQVQNLLKAQEYAEKTNDYKLKGLVYGDKADMYTSQDQNDSSICYSKKAYNSFRLIKDYRNSILALFSIASEFMKKSQFDSVRYYYQTASTFAHQTNDRVVVSYIYRNIGVTYFQQKEYTHALLNYWNAPITQVKIYDSNKFYLLGSLYVKTHQLDSAQYYLRKVTELGEMAPDYYRIWESLYEQKKDRIKALEYAHKVSIATDSLYKKKLETSFAGLEKKYKFQGLQITNQGLNIKNKQKGLYLLISSLILSVFILLYLFLKLRVKKNEVEYQKNIAIKKQELLEIEKENTAREKENNALLERQLKLQNILLSNIKIHKTNSEKRPTVWKDGSKETIEKQYEAFYNELKTYVDMEFNNFTTRLKEKHPVLTENDMFISCLLISEFKTGMIATILDVQADSINKYRYRLRTKLKLLNSDNLLDYLLHF